MNNEKEIAIITGTTIMENHSNNIWQEKYRVAREETIRNINEIWKKILVEHS
jgi:hypothetical protein